jgi:hypothetical protein
VAADVNPPTPKRKAPESSSNVQEPKKKKQRQPRKMAICWRNTPLDILKHVMTFLSGAHLSALSLCCRELRAVGLKLPELHAFFARCKRETCSECGNLGSSPRVLKNARQMVQSAKAQRRGGGDHRLLHVRGLCTPDMLRFDNLQLCAECKKRDSVLLMQREAFEVYKGRLVQRRIREDEGARCVRVHAFQSESVRARATMYYVPDLERLCNQVYS